MDNIIPVPDLLILYRELVIVSDFFPDGDWLFGVDDNLAGAINLDHFGVTIGLEEANHLKSLNQSIIYILTSHEWLINLARFPHFVASTT